MKTLIITLLTAVSIMITANLCYAQVGTGTKTSGVSTDTTTTKVDDLGNTRIGNTTYIKPGGSADYKDRATTPYEDMKVPVKTEKPTNENKEKSKFSLLIEELSDFWFADDKTDQKTLFYNVQMPEAKSKGTHIYPRIHWVNQNELSSNDEIVWGFEYAWVNVGDEFPSTTTTIYAPVIPNGTPLEREAQLMITAFPSIGGVDTTLSSMLVWRAFRADINTTVDGERADNLAEDVKALEFDFHYQIASDGSRPEYGK